MLAWNQPPEAMADCSCPVRLSEAAATFASRCFGEPVPGIGSMADEC